MLQHFGCSQLRLYIFTSYLRDKSRLQHTLGYDFISDYMNTHASLMALIGCIITGSSYNQTAGNVWAWVFSRVMRGPYFQPVDLSLACPHCSHPRLPFTAANCRFWSDPRADFSGRIPGRWAVGRKGELQPTTLLYIPHTVRYVSFRTRLLQTSIIAFNCIVFFWSTQDDF